MILECNYFLIQFGLKATYDKHISLNKTSATWMWKFNTCSWGLMVRYSKMMISYILVLWNRDHTEQVLF